LHHKYPTEKPKEGAVSSEPFGWGDRRSNMTLEEMTLQNSAKDLAVAEIHLKDKATDFLNVSKYSSMPSRLTPAINQPVHMGSASAGPSTVDNTQVMQLLLETITTMNTKMTKMQETLDIVEKRTERLMEFEAKLLETLQNTNR
jgi:hypothetical protein